MDAGWENLRIVREKLGLTMRDVESASHRIARRRNNEEFFIPISRLSDFETKGVIPSIYRLYTLAAIYRRNFGELFSWYGVEAEVSLSDSEAATLPVSHLAQALAQNTSVHLCRCEWIPHLIPKRP
jgi:transcriptional regulator with XRE-family HTH domain